ncbi:integrase [Novosphingobium bradum]|uniref:Integrase n=1 Tax=Novosphingobium bradum TaxID=1737444 RepID=A0ABV7IRN2_9SPHN
MATITKRKTGWSVQVRRKGYAPRSRTFRSKSEAEVWARDQEAEIDRGNLPVCDHALKTETLNSLLDRYLLEVTPRKRSKDSESKRLRKLQRHPICALAIRDLKPGHLAEYRNERLASVKAGTVRRELGLLHHLFDVAMREWGLPLSINPLKKVSLPVIGNARDRRLEGGELGKLERALASNRNPFVAPAVRLAIHTSLRRQEVLDLRWSAIDLHRRTAFIPVTKTGQSRVIPLTDAAIKIIRSMECRKGEQGADDRLFPITINAFKLAWKRVQRRSSLIDFRFHDLRHEAISRFAEMGLSTVELAVISGHRDPRMLFRYTHLRPADLARKLAGRSWEQEVGV